MGWHLNEDISFCHLDARLFFLDVKRDCYFQLPRMLELSFLRYLESPNDVDVDVGELVRHNLLTRTSTEGSWSSNGPDIASPNRSVLETPCFGQRVSASAIRDVFIIVCMMRWQLRTWSLKSILRSLSEYRRVHTPRVAVDVLEVQQDLAESAAAFNRVWPYVPIETCCLITTQANDLMRPIHQRMPVILDESTYDAWLDPAATANTLKQLLQPTSNEELETWQVSTAVNNVKTDGPDLVEPV